ncbi:hypothetical protein LTR91_000099 [Friedmanniomyces endolithicus]|uniref:Uncharacterized protein n=1 Tax=Friedmanniomyces endolithicus TaxID=329885 RepID=A0AAN6R2E1_9PEZI|nr:hypothetical protein LTR35_001534 [Friedmanniomyces endolithicus]KAK0298019.1 hypothetical protein LTS00_003558 [Friedmanniomyces endolithicus]KAK0931152.1 hypothetical protein LTR57_000565 [Friedmanniomyces endolithicus]KAK1016081.1 hypothetical protein LTR91_000099 [Friedmanniomyces endolithicus]KAK1018324.1 hypothetical protein LTR54_001210 [Friedmanniomyces endolithicus]
MASTATYLLAVILVAMAAVGGYIAVLVEDHRADKLHSFGIPPQLKRQMEEKALETMGENKASYMMKDAIGQMPASDQQNVKDFQKGLGNIMGGSMQNPLGKFTGNTADDVTKEFTGR